MISADLVESLKKVLPVEQNLIPVSFKKKLQYSGHYIQEYVDKKKIQIYFNWLRSYNHLFEDYSLEKKLINDFEIKSMKTIHMIDAEKSESIVAQHNVIEKKISSFITDEIFDSDEEHDETMTLEKENISCYDYKKNQIWHI